MNLQNRSFNLSEKIIEIQKEIFDAFCNSDEVKERIVFLNSIASFPCVCDEVRNGLKERYAEEKDSSVKKGLKKIIGGSNYLNVITELKKEYNSLIKDFYKTEDLHNPKKKKNNKTSFQKGKALENFAISFLSKVQGFEFKGTNMKLNGREIDIVFVNNCNHYILRHSASPYIFVECKNWKKPIGPGQVDPFLRKIESNIRLVKMGIIISLNGFTKSIAMMECKRAANQKGISLAFITKKDFDNFFNFSEDFVDFIIKKINPRNFW
ncbi:MAG: hypothetical protein GF308_22290 [Candidatus Heimdallarchaeota archaeon]|nr:hypothetical protein [Candidatus Heimdallarchaeota archaeon]